MQQFEENVDLISALHKNKFVGGRKKFAT